MSEAICETTTTTTKKSHEATLTSYYWQHRSATVKPHAAEDMANANWSSHFFGKLAQGTVRRLQLLLSLLASSVGGCDHG